MPCPLAAVRLCPDAHRPGGRWSSGCTSGSRRSPRRGPRSTRPEGRAPAGASPSPEGRSPAPPEGGRYLGVPPLAPEGQGLVGLSGPEGPCCPARPGSPDPGSEDPGVRRTLEQARASASFPGGRVGSARPGASGAGLRRVPRLPLAARVQAISSASFFIGLRRGRTRLGRGTPRWPKPAVLPHAVPSTSCAEAQGQPPKRRGAVPGACRVRVRRRLAGAEAPIPRAEARGRRGVGTRGCRSCRGP